MSYATLEDVTKGFRVLSSEETKVCEDLLEEADLVIDAYKSDVSDSVKKRVSIRMIRRALGDGEGSAFPIGSSQGSISALGYSQSWTMGASGTTGELYLNKMDKRLLGVGNRIGSYSPVER